MSMFVNRREFLTGAGATTLLLPQLYVRGDEVYHKRQFRLWATGDAHIGTDLRRNRESLAEAIRQSEFGGDEGGPPFEWDIAINVGDYSGSQRTPDDEEGRAVVKQLSVLKKHNREDFYSLAGNHDANGPLEPTQWWFKKWIDPTGENTKHSGIDNARRKYPITGTWERYSFRVGNILFLIMSDRNDVGPPVGRGRYGGYPAGAVTEETFHWWRNQVATNPSSLIITAHHHVLKETTVASGEWEGFRKRQDGTYASHYHGYFADGAPKGASYLYWLGDQPDAQAFEQYLAGNNSAIDLWLGGHTHTNPDDNHNGRTHIEQKWGATFINCAALTRYHVARTSVPQSRLLTFTEGSTKVRVQCYLHTSQYAKQGWYHPAERTITLSKPFKP